VLIVDDNPVNRMLAQRLVEKLGCPVTTANDGLEAYERVMSERFDIVLMDCHMPVLDGFEATRRLRAVERERALPRLPVVAMTAGALDEDRRQCHDAGMDDHLPKPIRAADLAAALRRWCVKTPV
jgi:CheY-like chemotaxis protein